VFSFVVKDLLSTLGNEQKLFLSSTLLFPNLYQFDIHNQHHNSTPLQARVIDDKEGWGSQFAFNLNQI